MTCDIKFVMTTFHEFTIDNKTVTATNDIEECVYAYMMRDEQMNIPLIKTKSWILNKLFPGTSFVKNYVIDECKKECEKVISESLLESDNIDFNFTVSFGERLTRHRENQTRKQLLDNIMDREEFYRALTLTELNYLGL